jgi:hypothetical protein
MVRGCPRASVGLRHCLTADDGRPRSRPKDLKSAPVAKPGHEPCTWQPLCDAPTLAERRGCTGRISSERRSKRRHGGTIHPKKLEVCSLPTSFLRFPCATLHHLIRVLVMVGNFESAQGAASTKAKRSPTRLPTPSSEQPRGSALDAWCHCANANMPRWFDS